MRDWYRLNETRESWVFLLLQVDEMTSKLNQWAVGAGNISHLVRTSEQTLSTVGSEPALLRQLGNEASVDRTADPILITPDAETLALLRQRLISNRLADELSLREFSHVSLEEMVKTYFADDVPNLGSKHSYPEQLESVPSNTESIESLWQLWTQIVPLVPGKALAGGRL